MEAKHDTTIRYARRDAQTASAASDVSSWSIPSRYRAHPRSSSSNQSHELRPHYDSRVVISSGHEHRHVICTPPSSIDRKICQSCPLQLESGTDWSAHFDLLRNRQNDDPSQIYAIERSRSNVFGQNLTDENESPYEQTFHHVSSESRIHGKVMRVSDHCDNFYASPHRNQYDIPSVCPQLLGTQQITLVQSHPVSFSNPFQYRDHHRGQNSHDFHFLQGTPMKWRTRSAAEDEGHTCRRSILPQLKALLPGSTHQNLRSFPISCRSVQCHDVSHTPIRSPPAHCYLSDLAGKRKVVAVASRRMHHHPTGHRVQLKQKLLMTLPSAEKNDNHNFDENGQKSRLQIMNEKGASLKTRPGYKGADGNFNHVSWFVHYVTADHRCLENNIFRDKMGHPLLFSDNSDFDPDDGSRSLQFLNPLIETSLSAWFLERKQKWRGKWRVFQSTSADAMMTAKAERLTFELDDESCEHVIPCDFWLSSGFPTFQHWLSASKVKWRRNYSWNRLKRRKLEAESTEIVQFPSTTQSLQAGANLSVQFDAWLRVRRNQWLILRRRRQRRLAEEKAESVPLGGPQLLPTADHKNLNQTEHEPVEPDVDDHFLAPIAGRALKSPSSVASFRSSMEKSWHSSSSVAHIDAMIDDEVRHEKAFVVRPPLNIMFIFDATLGAPDDAMAHTMRFLPVSEHWKLLCISKTTYASIRQREVMWRALCPSHWILPRRPRKSWHTIYVTKIREEEEETRKRSEDVLLKAANIVLKADHLHKIEKLISSAQKAFGFDINFNSGVVLERNSLLNLAVIDGRHKIAKWLVEVKLANIETFDRGQFTPLLNAAWSGDKYMVRFLLSKGADRNKLGTCHSSQGLAPTGFKGLKAEDWAQKRGHDDVAELIRLGLA